jgi:anaerobic ribonucleoside-triphosphate reductase
LGCRRDLGQNEVGWSKLEHAARGNRNWVNLAAVELRAGNIRKENKKGKGGLPEH